MLELKIDIEVKFAVDCYDLDKFISEVYQQSFEFVPDVECGNDSSHTFNVAKGEVKYEYDILKIADFNDTGRGTYLTRMLLCDMCDKDLIPAGEYLIKVSW